MLRALRRSPGRLVVWAVVAVLLSGCARPLARARLAPETESPYVQVAKDWQYPWENVLRVRPGTRLQITLHDGRVATGQFAEARTDQVSLSEVVGVPTAPDHRAVFLRPEIAKIERLERTRPLSGPALGAIIGAVAGFVVAAGWLGLVPDDDIPVRFWHLESFSSVGAGVGALAGWLADRSRRHDGKSLIYLAPTG